MIERLRARLRRPLERLLPAAFALLFPPHLAAQQPGFVVQLNTTTPDVYIGQQIAIDDGLVVSSSENYSSSTGVAILYDAETGEEIRPLVPRSRRNASNFGSSVDISGDRVVVGARRENAGSFVTSDGVAYLFDANTGQQLHRLVASDAQRNAYFGAEVVIEGDLAVVGAYQHNDSDGQAYVFDVETGAELHRLHYEGPKTSGREYFGFSLAMDSATIAVGAPGGYSTSKGRAFLFDVETGLQSHELTLPTLETGDQFGQSVALNGGIVAVGAPSPYFGAGSVYLFDAVSGDLLREINPPNGVVGDNFGVSVALEGDALLVAASNRERDGVEYAGELYLFDARTGALHSTFGAPDTIRQQFGWGLDVDGGYAAIIGAQPIEGSIFRLVEVPEPDAGAIAAIALVTTFGVCGALRPRLRQSTTFS